MKAKLTHLNGTTSIVEDESGGGNTTWKALAAYGDETVYRYAGFTTVGGEMVSSFYAKAAPSQTKYPCTAKLEHLDGRVTVLGTCMGGLYWRDPLNEGSGQMYKLDGAKTREFGHPVYVLEPMDDDDTVQARIMRAVRIAHRLTGIDQLSNAKSKGLDSPLAIQMAHEAETLMNEVRRLRAEGWMSQSDLVGACAMLFYTGYTGPTARHDALPSDHTCAHVAAPSSGAVPCIHEDNRLVGIGGAWCPRCGALGFLSPDLTSRVWEMPFTRVEQSEKKA